MRILAFEFSSPQRSVAVVCPKAGGWQSVSEVIETGARATRALSLVEAALQQAQIEREQIEGIAVGLGPGSYTGIRAAIALARGWQFARPVKLLGISSVECAAAQAQAEGVFGRLALVIDAQRRELYFALYETSREGWRELEPLRLVTIAQAREALRSGVAVAGPEANKWFPGARLVFPRAAILGQLAATKADNIPEEPLEPIYLREPQFIKAPPPRWPAP